VGRGSGPREGAHLAIHYTGILVLSMEGAHFKVLTNFVLLGLLTFYQLSSLDSQTFVS
jgi:hypothetical protein